MGWVFPLQSLEPVTINLRGIRWKFFREVFIPDYLGRLRAQTPVSLGGVLPRKRGRGRVTGADTEKRGQQEDRGARNARSHQGLEGQGADGGLSLQRAGALPGLPSGMVTQYILVVLSPQSGVICHLRTSL